MTERCSTCGQDASITTSYIAELEAEVARLTEEREEVIKRASLWQRAERVWWAQTLLERDRQREDIRRLVGALKRAIPSSPQNEKEDTVLLAELKGWYE